jgi:hypothetical protein
MQQYPNYVCRVTSDENYIGAAHLDKFKDVETLVPAILTTSKLLTTGVDMPTVKNVVIARVVNTMTEFKQIIGRGTRVHEDTKKYFFTIIDFRKATNNFAEPEFDGEPVSIYEPNSLKRLCDFFIPDIVQAPINVLDRRLIEDSILDDLHNLGVEIHARSIFLQGLLLMPINKIPNYFLPWNNLLEAWHLSCRLQGVSLLQGALSFMESLNFIDYYILGVESSSQLKELIEALKDPISFNSDGLSSYDPNLIYPNKWRLS